MRPSSRGSLILLGVLAFGYILGHAFPISLLSRLFHFLFLEKTTTPEIQVSVISQLFVGVATLLAVGVALFREDIRRIWDRPKLVLTPRVPSFLREVINGQSERRNRRGASGRSSPTRAQKYLAEFEERWPHLAGPRITVS